MTSQGDKQSTLGGMGMGMEMETAYDDGSTGDSVDTEVRTYPNAQLILHRDTAVPEVGVRLVLNC